ncbi:MAG: hypothetical protein ACRDGQ_09930 [Candidatus Limnocylindrales bacterium]
MEDDPLERIPTPDVRLTVDRLPGTRRAAADGGLERRPRSIGYRPAHSADLGGGVSQPESGLHGWPAASVSPDELATWFG